MVLGDTRFAYVKWSTGKDKFDVLPMSSFVLTDVEYAPDLEFKVKFGLENKVYRCIIQFIGKLI